MARGGNIYGNYHFAADQKLATICGPGFGRNSKLGLSTIAKQSRAQERSVYAVNVDYNSVVGTSPGERIGRQAPGRSFRIILREGEESARP